MKVRVHHCVRCGHDWVRRDLADTTRPRVCPKCKDGSWDKPYLTPAQRSAICRRSVKIRWAKQAAARPEAPSGRGNATD